VKQIAHDPEAQRDIFGAVRFYEDRVPGLGGRFLRILDETMAKIASQPEQFAFFQKPARSCRVHGFPYRVIYVNEPEFVLIVAVSHDARQPNWWRHRLQA
jgi:toxin ParE1/3/4